VAAMMRNPPGLRPNPPFLPTLADTRFCAGATIAELRDTAGLRKLLKSNNLPEIDAN